MSKDAPRSQAAAKGVTRASEPLDALGRHGHAASCRGRVPILLGEDTTEATRQLELAAEVGKQRADPQLVAEENWRLSMLDGLAGNIPEAVERLLQTADGWRELGVVAGELSALERILQVLPIVGRLELGPPLWSRH